MSRALASGAAGFIGSAVARHLIFGYGGQTRAFSYIDDQTPVIARSVKELSAYRETSNMWADKTHSVSQLVLAVCKGTKVKPEICCLPCRYEVRNACVSHKEAKKCFDSPESERLRDGLSRMARAGRRVGYREPTSLPRIELPNGLPNGW